MPLHSGTKIFCQVNTTDRVMLSAGTRRVEKVNGVVGKSPICIPHNEWRTPNKTEEKKLYLGFNESSSFQQINVVKLPNELINTLQKANIVACKTPEEVFAIAETAYWQTACLPPLIDYIQQFMTVEEEPYLHPFYIGQANLETVTKDKYNEYTGLHLDSWEAADTLSERSKSRTRICFNLGLEPRYLLVLNLNLKQVFDISEIAQNTDFQTLIRNEYSYLWEFLHDYPDYPITRIKIEPYEAYIAPTENMLHDGSTLGNSCPDIHLTFRSYFQYQPSLFQRMSNSFHNFF